MMHKHLRWLASGFLAMNLAAALPISTMAQSSGEDTTTPITSTSW